jgi:hypothetical protein
MAEIAVPRTPSPGAKNGRIDNRPLEAKFTSPPPLSSSDLTPPPSTQFPRYTPRLYHFDSSATRDSRLSSPLERIGTPTPSKIESWNGPVPSVEKAQSLPEGQLRELVAHLISLLGETRMQLAHAKLQHNLLALESSEAAQRAAVEHDMTRREVEVLQASNPLFRSRRRSTPKISPPPSESQKQLESVTQQVRRLETENMQLQRRLKKSKKIIKHLDGRNGQLTDDNHLLRQRIRENREHINAMRASGVYLAAPGDNPKAVHGNHSLPAKAHVDAQQRQGRGQDPFDALLFAGQVLSAEPSSVPSTPIRTQSTRFQTGHIRGTHSLSSLPVTPNRSRPLTADNALLTPLNQPIPLPTASFSAPAPQIGSHAADPNRDDRDSTISASDPEEALTDDDVPPSQASQAASSMLRANPGPVPEASVAESHDRFVQTKLTGKLAKHPNHDKLASSQGRSEGYYEEGGEARSKKRLKIGGMVDRNMGLGIGMWPSPDQ